MKKSLGGMREHRDEYGVGGKGRDEMLDEEMTLKLQENQLKLTRMENAPAQSRDREDRRLAMHLDGICRALVSSLVVYGQDTLRPLGDTGMRIRFVRMILMTTTYQTHTLMWVYHLTKPPIHTSRKSIQQQWSAIRLPSFVRSIRTSPPSDAQRQGPG